jgi:hypothetical protein
MVINRGQGKFFFSILKTIKKALPIGRAFSI